MAEPTVAEQAGKLLSQVAGYVGVRTIEIGLRFGLIREIAGHPDGIAPEVLAKETGLDPFYVEVWCRSAFGAEVLESAGDGAYRLAPHIRTVLLDPDSPTYAAATFSAIVQPEIFDRFAESLPTGERTWWDRTGPAWIDAVSGSGRAFYNRLIPAGLERVPGLKATLEEGARVLELASGAGVGLVKLAGSYPSSTFVGVDGDAYSLELAATNLRAAGLDGRVELVQTALEDVDRREEFDVAVINISMHECRDIERVTANVARALAPGGTFVISDFPFPEGRDGLRTVPARVMLGIQFFEALIDDQLLPTRAFVELLERHGFRDVGSFDLTPLHAVTHGRR